MNPIPPAPKSPATNPFFAFDKLLPNNFFGSMQEEMFEQKGGRPTIANSLEEKFLQVIDFGIDWQDNEKNRSTFDLIGHIDLDKVVSLGKKADPSFDLATKYINYLYGQLTFFIDLDETYVPHHLGQDDFDDSLPDMFFVLGKIEQHYQKNNVTFNPQINPSEWKTTLDSLEEIISWGEEYDDLEEMIDTSKQGLKRVHELINKFSKKRPKP